MRPSSAGAVVVGLAVAVIAGVALGARLDGSAATGASGVPAKVVAGAAASPATSPQPVHRSAVGRRVMLIVVDGLDARDVAVEDTPVLARAWHESSWCPGVEGRAAMPAVTNANHATLLTGVHPEIHGVIGNAFWDRSAAAPRKLGAAADFLTETLFTVAQHTRPTLRTAAALGKSKLALMFAATAGQAAPQALWEPEQAADSDRDPITRYAYDAATLAGVRGLWAAGDAEFLLVNLADVDRVAHGVGPHSANAAAARRATDAAIGELLAFVRGREDWGRTTIVITSDHGFDTVLRPPLAFGSVAMAEGWSDVVSVGDGGVGHVYLRDAVPAAERDARLAAVRGLALRTQGIADAIYLAPNAVDGGAAFTLASLHPDWHLVHPRSGDLLLIAGPGTLLSDAPNDVKLLGSHGSPAETRVPVIVLREGPRVTDDCGGITAADLGRTLFSCLALRDVERLDGAAIPPAGRGRILSGVCP